MTLEQQIKFLKWFIVIWDEAESNDEDTEGLLDLYYAFLDQNRLPYDDADELYARLTEVKG